MTCFLGIKGTPAALQDSIGREILRLIDNQNTVYALTTLTPTQTLVSAGIGFARQGLISRFGLANQTL